MYRMFLLSIRTLNGLNKGESGEVFLHRGSNSTTNSQHYVDKDGMAYSLFFLESVKSVDAEFYKDHVGPVKNR